VGGLIAYFLRQILYKDLSFENALMDFAYLLAITLPFVLYILFVTRKERNQLLNRIYIDKLTDLPNREKLRLDACRMDCSLFLINIDAFKEFNDFYGFRIGDYIIKEMASRLKRLILKRSSLVFRHAQLYKLETDEYAILVHRVLTRELAVKAAGLISAVNNDHSFRYKNHEMSVTATIGIALGSESPPQPGNPDRTPSILARADMALKAAKNSHYHFLVYEESMKIPRMYQENIQWTKKLKKSIQEDRIVPYFQPIINNKTRHIEKFECLIRILDDGGGVIYPSSFLKISKRSHLYPSLTRIMINRALDEARKNQDYEYSVNISVEDIENQDTAGLIESQLEINRDIAYCICFEILETEYIENIETVKAFIAMVKEKGCSIAIDDFGSGYSNFNYLIELDIDYIKIDESLIKNLCHNQNARIISETIVDFCQRMGLKTIAEHVHSREIQQAVEELKIDYSQGFYLGKPYRIPQFVLESVINADSPQDQIS
jgi:diguanylate cyclase (GGDEF)-like protein